MSPLNWQDNHQKGSPRSPDTTNGINPWFGISMALFGLIVGFGTATFMNVSNTGGKQQAVAQARSVPSQPTPQAQAPAAIPQAIDFKTDHIRGNLKANVAVIEYSDYECPFCKRFEPTMQQISKDYGDTVMLVYRHFPLSFHANAQKEAEASDCANDQGKFWEYHDKILERTTSNGTGFPLENLVPLAKELGLDDAKFKSCLDTGEYAKHVQDEETAGQTAGVSGTPGTFVLNLKTQKQQFISGAQPFANFKAAIDPAL